MNRTLYDWKNEEKALSKILYKRLKWLSMAHPQPEELKKVFNTTMFIVHNPTVFSEVMHYLFMILDPEETKKQFLWPIKDHKSETLFRSSCADFLKRLNEKHHLNLANIPYLTLKPVGLKFLTFLIGFIDFITKELTKKLERKVFRIYNLKNREEVQQFNIQAAVEEFSKFKAEAEQYSCDIQKNLEEFKEKRGQIERVLEDIANSQGIPVQQLMNKAFLNSWDRWNNDYVSECLRNSNIELLGNFEESLRVLKDTISNISTRKADLSCDNRLMLRSLNAILSATGSAQTDICRPITEVDFSSVVKAFNAVTPSINENLEIIQQTICNDWKHLFTNLQVLAGKRAELNSLLANNFGGLPVKIGECTPPREKLLTESGFQLKFINTPPITFDVERPKILMPRLPFLKDCSTDGCIINSKTQSTLVNQTNLNQSSGYYRSPSTANKKIMDPNTLLRSLKNKSCTSSQSSSTLSSLALKWKEKELMLLHDSDSQITLQNNQLELDSENEEQMKNSLPKFESPIKKIIEESLMDSKKANSPCKNLNASFPWDKFSLDLTQSPSGRLDSIVALKPIPLIKINDHTLMDASKEYIECSQSSEDTNSGADFLNASRECILDISDTILQHTPL